MYMYMIVLDRQVLEIAVKSPERRYSSSEYDLGALKACRYTRIVVIQIVVIVVFRTLV